MTRQHPGYNHTSFSLGFKVARHLPRGFCRGLGGAIAMAGYLQNAPARAAQRRNLRQVIGENGAGLERVCRANFRNFGRMLGDYFYCASHDESAIRRLLHHWTGLEHLEAARAAGRGTILVTAHLGNWELGGTFLALEGWPINIVTLEEPTGELTQMRDEYRRKLGIKTITVGEDPFSFVEMIAALKRNEILCMLVDRPYGGTGLPVEFFGESSQFSSAPALLRQHTGAAVIPAFVVHEAGHGYRAFAQPALPLEPGAGEDRKADLLAHTQALASAFENIIRQHPEQWFNYVPIWKNPIADPSEP